MIVPWSWMLLALVAGWCSPQWLIFRPIEREMDELRDKIQMAEFRADIRLARWAGRSEPREK